MKYLYIILLVLPLIGFGQGWEQIFGSEISDEIGYSVKQTSDGGYVIGGHNEEGSQGWNVWIIKTDENGNEEWSQIYDVSDGMNDHCYDIQQTIDLGYVVTGSTSWGVLLMKVDQNGQEEWVQQFETTKISDQEGRFVQQTMDGGYVIIGTTVDQWNPYDSYLIKTDENGNEQWSQIFGNEEWYEGLSGQQTTDGGYVITGRLSCPGSLCSYLIKTDENGNEQWSQIYEENTVGYSLKQTTDGGYVICGGIETSSLDIYLLKTDDNGDIQWSQTFGGDFIDIGYSLQQTMDGGYIITGGTQFFGTEDSSLDIFLIKTDENGNEEWFQNYVFETGGIGFSVQQTTDGGYIITGHLESQDIFLIKTDSEGNVETTSTIELPTPTSKRELIKTTNILGQENTTIKNQPMIEIYDDGSVEKKYIIE